MSDTHLVKCWPEQFAAVRAGIKSFEFRKNDRNYKVGDTLVLQEFYPENGWFSGEDFTSTIVHVLNDGFGLPEGYAVLGLSVDPEQADMAEIGRSLMSWIEQLTTQEDSPVKDWTPAEDPSEIVPDLYNLLEESLACHRQAMEELKAMSALVSDGSALADALRANFGRHASKIKGSSWNGRVVGAYRSSLTELGLAIESDREPGSVQIYPETAIHFTSPPCVHFTKASPPLAHAAESRGAADVLAERQRQIDIENWSPEHDDRYNDNQLARAAACYLIGVTAYWPWGIDWWKPSEDRRRNLVKAGALILAEIERLDRAECAAAT